jgi:hypothetical protein
MKERLGHKLAIWQTKDHLILLATRLPRWTVFTLGVAGVGLGLLFLIVPQRFISAQSLHVLLATAPAVAWGCIFLSIGMALTTAAVIDHTRAHLLCLAMGIALLSFAGLSAYGAVVGMGTLVAPWLAIILGWICVFNAITTKAFPRLKEMLTSDQAARTHKP